jgi:enoyl-[acyl-carrier-protein] reductase (NADH)
MALGMKYEQFADVPASKAPARRLSTLPELANTAAFLASDYATGMTGTIVNLSMGTLDD